MANFKIFRKQMADGIDAESKRFDSLSDDITKEIIKKTKNITLDESQTKVIYAEDSQSSNGDFQSQGKISTSSVSKYNKLVESTKATIEKIATEMSSMNGLTDKQISAYKKQFGEEVFIAAEMLKQTELAKGQLQHTLLTVDATEKLAISTKKYHHALKTVDTLAKSAIGQFESLISSIVGNLFPNSILQLLVALFGSAN